MQFISDILEGIVILAILCAIYGFTNDMMAMAGEAQKDGLISYSRFTKLLID